MNKTTTTIGWLLLACCLAVAPAASASGEAPTWPQPPAAPADAPDIVLILLDDVGFGAASTFGGPAETPELDRLAAEGLRYNRFHTVAICSPTRASLLTGHNPHRVGFGIASGVERGFAGYNGLWARNTASVAQVLRSHGYGTAVFGKWHNTPGWELSPAGPFDHWPTALGFDRFYGFMGGGTTQWEPVLFRDTTLVDAPATPAQGYHLTSDIVDEAIGWMNAQHALKPDRPTFLYLAPGATHAPLHVPEAWIAKYRGRFDQGWDVLREQILARQKRLGVVPPDTELTPRPEELPAWDSLNADQRRLLARQMEVYAAFLAHTDHEVGRLLQAVRSGPRGDNTLVIYIVGDNGASAEGGLEGSDNDIAEFFLGVPPDSLAERLQRIDQLGNATYDNHYASAWAWATDAPFQWMKQVASHFGGTRNPLVISWPARIKDQGGLRQQFTYVADVVPTLYELIGIEAPRSVDGVTQLALDGRSFAYTLERADAPEPPRTQYFEMMGSRGLYKDGWMASAMHAPPWRQVFNRDEDFAKDRWELYHVAEDFSQAHDLAARYPDKLHELQRLFDGEARRNQVYPLGNGLPNPGGDPQPSLYAGRKEFVFGNGLAMPAAAAPSFLRSHRITVELSLPAQGAEGTLLTCGGRNGGFTLYVKGGRLVYENNYFGKHHDRLTSNRALPTGTRTRVSFEFTRDDPRPWAGGAARLFIDGELVAEGRLANVGLPSYYGSFAVGQGHGSPGHGSPVSDAYQVPFRFGGDIEQVKVEML